MADDTREYLPQRAADPIEESPLEGGRLAAFRARAERIALPAVLVLAVSAGLAFGGLAPKGAESENLTAAPAPAAMPERNADDVTRNLDRAADPVVPTPDAQLPTDAPASEGPEPAVAPVAAAEPKALSAFSASPAPSKAAESAAVTGKMYATEAVNVRSEPRASSGRIGSVARGESVGVTGRTSGDFTQVRVNDRAGWVASQYLSRTAPAAPAPARNAPAPASAPAPARAAQACAPLRGLQSNTEALHQALCANFPAVTSYGGVRPDWDAEHPSGRALDAMVSSIGTGDAVANWARANAGRFGITEVIWNQRIWTTQRAGEGWRAMSDRGSATANHRDHVHISVR